MSDWVPFKTKCPSCPNNATITWVHSDDNYEEEIDKNGNIRCNNTSCEYYKNPTFIMEWGFDCGSHNYHGDYWKPKALGVFTALGMISSIKALSKTERQKLFDRVNDYF